MSCALESAIEAIEQGARKIVFLLTWHFPDRRTWTPSNPETDEDIIGNHYTRRFADAWEAAEHVAGGLAEYERGTVTFAAQAGRWFWSTGYAWGTCALESKPEGFQVALQPLHERLVLEEFRIAGFGSHRWSPANQLEPGASVTFRLPKA